MKKNCNIKKENLSIEITTKCNSNCLHCFARAGLTKYQSLSYQVIRQIISEAFDLGYRNLHLTGGEPLLHESFFLIIEYAFSIGYEKIFCNSNGSLFTKENCQKLYVYKNKLSFSISLHGAKELHDKICGKGSHKKACEGIINAINMGLDISIFTSIGKSLLPELEQFAEVIFAEFPTIVELTLLQMIRIENDSYNLSSELLTPDDFVKFVKIISRLCLYGLKIKVLDNSLATVAAQQLGLYRIFKTSTTDMFGRLIIMANKDIRLDHSIRSSLAKYRTGILKKILSSEEYSNLIKADTEICPKCQFYKICKKNEMIRPSSWYRDMNSEVPYCKRVLCLCTN